MRYPIVKYIFILLLVFQGFFSTSLLRAQTDNSSLEQLKKTLDHHNSFDSIQFYYRYEVQTIDQDFNWVTEKKNAGNFRVTKSDLEGLIDSEGNEGLVEYKSALKSIRIAVINERVKQSSKFNSLPYFVIELQNNPIIGLNSVVYNNNQTVYIDTLSYLIHAISTVVNKSDGRVLLNTFILDSVAPCQPLIKPDLSPFQLNKNMLQAGSLAPDFSTNDANGNRVNLSDYKGKLLLLDFWYSACKPCIKASHDLEELKKKYAGRGLVILGMNSVDRASKIQRHNAKFNVSYKSLVCGRDIIADYKIKAYPSIYLVSSKGEILYSSSGYSINFKKDLEQAILKAISIENP